MLDLNILGDPHLDRSFVHGVPLARRGDREKMVWDQFEASVSSPGSLHVNLGDIFDKAIVSYDTVLKAYMIYAASATANPESEFVILRGNHDLLRDLTRKSAYDMLKQLLKPYSSIHFVESVPLRIGQLAFVGFDPITPAGELLGEDLRGCDTIFGHWDIDSFGQVVSNLIPTQRIAELGIGKAITGHVHKPSHFERDGVEVTVFGSMQPYAHGQEINDNLYITLSLTEALGRTDLANKCVRITLEADEVLDQQIDCLQLTLQRKAANVDAPPEVELGEFNMVNFFQEAFSEVGLTNTMSERVLEEYERRHLVGAD